MIGTKSFDSQLAIRWLFPLVEFQRKKDSDSGEVWPGLAGLMPHLATANIFAFDGRKNSAALRQKIPSAALPFQLSAPLQLIALGCIFPGPANLWRALHWLRPNIILKQQTVLRHSRL